VTEGTGDGQEPSLAWVVIGSNVHTVDGTPTDVKDTGREARTIDRVPTSGLVVSEITMAYTLPGARRGHEPGVPTFGVVKFTNIALPI